MSEDEKILKERRVNGIENAYSIYTNMDSKNDLRVTTYSQIENQLNGGTPFNPDKLVSSGQSWRTNVNFRDADSTLEQVLVSYWRLLHDSVNLARMELHLDHANTSRWEQTFEHNVNRFVEDWADDYVRNYLLFSKNHLAFGVGTVGFPNLESPRWEVIRTGDILVPERTPACASKVELCCYKQEMSISDLWDRIRTPQDKSNSRVRGWNLANIQTLLHKAIKGTLPEDRSNLMEIEDAVRNNSMRHSMTHGPIKVIHMLVKEFDDKISHMIFPQASQEIGFLFDNHETNFRADSIEESLAMVFFEAGNGLFHGVRGFGHKNFQLATIQNRLKSRAIDRTMIEGINFKDMGDGLRTTFPIINQGPYNVVPKELEQLPHYPGSSTIFDAIGMVQDNQNWNNARYRDKSQQVADTETATQARILSNLQSQVDVANSTLYLTQYARNILSQMIARLRRRGSSDPDAKLFKKRCVDEGRMPEEVFHDAEVTVLTGADPGAASRELQAEIAFQLLGMKNRRINYDGAIEVWVQSSMGARGVKKVLLPENDLEDKAAIRTATMENTSLGDGISIPVVDSDAHHVHVEVHLEPLEGMLESSQATQEGMVGMPQDPMAPPPMTISPEQILAFQTTLPHIAEHLDYLKQDEFMQEEFQALFPRYKDVEARASGMINKMFEQATAFQNQQQFAPQGDPLANENPTQDIQQVDGQTPTGMPTPGPAPDGIGEGEVGPLA